MKRTLAELWAEIEAEELALYELATQELAMDDAIIAASVAGKLSCSVNFRWSELEIQ